tara:strand:+ start:3081 stop:3797 length:717 start_codon:yes stop_codon:yes gene_type:complete
MDNKIIIPKYMSQLNIDIGLSFSACHTNLWLKKNNKLFVIGIEALKSNIDKIKEGKQTTYHHREKDHYLDINFLKEERCLLLNYALVNSDLKSIDFYKTLDPGQCSIFKPPTTRNIYKVDDIIKVDCCKLKDILERIEFNEEIQYVSYIKIDAQGADLDIVKSGEEILKEKVVYITLEPETTYSSGMNNSKNAIKKYMMSIGFNEVRLNNVCDPTYLNSKYNNLYPPEKYGIICIQNN